MSSFSDADTDNRAELVGRVGILADHWTIARKVVSLAAVLVLAFSGCTIHPQGERAEREAANRAGKAFEERPEARVRPTWPDNPSPEQLVDYALLTNADLERVYWQWRSAIEQVPQDGTQPTNLVLSANWSISRGGAGLSQATISVGNDPMADIVLPPKLSAAATRALQNARAAGMRFRKAQFELRAKVLSAWYDYALNSELIRLERANGQLLKTTLMVVESRNRVGSAALQDAFKARNELDLSGNDLAGMQTQLVAQRAALNALLDRAPAMPLPEPSPLPAPPIIPYSDVQILDWASAWNPELTALAREVAANEQGVALAKLQYLPDISLNAGTDLKGIVQSAFAAVTVPILRREAIDAAVAQAQANVRAAEAMRRQSASDLASQVVQDLSFLRDADRQLPLFEKTILPRAEQAISLGRSAYESGNATLLDLLESQRSLISIQRLVANLRAARAKRLAELDAITARRLDGDQTSKNKNGSWDR